MLTRKEYLETLEGSEVWSLHFADCVGIQNGLLHFLSSDEPKTPTTKELQILFQEACENDGIGFESI